MSVSLYYTAKRDYPMSAQEEEACLKVVEHYIEHYPLGNMYEGFCVYDLNEESEENVIFDGATKLPVDKGQKHFEKVYNYWTDCLQDIIHLLPDAEWHIHIDDTNITPYFDYPQ